MKTKMILILLAFSLFACNVDKKPKTISLFNGVDLTGWHVDVPALDENPDTINPFIVRDSMLVSLGTPGGHLITDSIYSNYSWKWNIVLQENPEIAVFWFMHQLREPCIRCFQNRSKCRECTGTGWHLAP